MSRIPNSIDELMWLVAEQRDASAMDGFVQRYPEYRSELLKRVEMVRSLKDSRGATLESTSIPVFRPRHLRESPTVPRWAWTTASAFGLALVAYGSYVVVARNPLNPPAKSEIVRLQPPANMGLNKQMDPINSETRLQLSADPNEKNRNPLPPTPAERVITLKFDRIPLVEALASLSASSGVRFELAPNMPNPDVVVDYQGVPVSEILTDMGNSFGFTAFKQSDSSYLIIPAVDPDRKPATDPSHPEQNGRTEPIVTAEPGTEGPGSRTNAYENH